MRYCKQQNCSLFFVGKRHGMQHIAGTASWNHDRPSLSKVCHMSRVRLDLFGCKLASTIRNVKRLAISRFGSLAAARSAEMPSHGPADQPLGFQFRSLEKRWKKCRCIGRFRLQQVFWMIFWLVFCWPIFFWMKRMKWIEMVQLDIVIYLFINLGPRKTLTSRNGFCDPMSLIRCHRGS